MTTTVVTAPGITTVISDQNSGETTTATSLALTTIVSSSAQPGLQGPAGDGVATIYPFTSPVATWTVPHGLGRYPQLSLIDDVGAVFEADVEFPDLNTAVITHAQPTSGSVLIS